MRKRVEETATRLFREIPGIRIAVFAHGDYQDKPQTYDTKWVDFTSDKKKVCDFIKNVSSTCGYDSDECYELVLRQVRFVRIIGVHFCDTSWFSPEVWNSFRTWLKEWRMFTLNAFYVLAKTVLEVIEIVI